MKKLIAAVFFSLTISAAQAVQPLDVSDPWVRATVPGQEITGAFMQLKSAVNAKLVKAESPVAEAVEIHFRSMKNGVMEMRQVDT